MRYSARGVEYRTFDAAALDVLRLSFRPSRVTAGGIPLRGTEATPSEAGYTLQSLPGGDWIVRVRHVDSGEMALGG